MVNQLVKIWENHRGRFVKFFQERRAYDVKRWRDDVDEAVNVLEANLLGGKGQLLLFWYKFELLVKRYEEFQELSDNNNYDNYHNYHVIIRDSKRYVREDYSGDGVIYYFLGERYIRDEGRRNNDDFIYHDGKKYIRCNPLDDPKNKQINYINDRRYRLDVEYYYRRRNNSNSNRGYNGSNNRDGNSNRSRHYNGSNNRDGNNNRSRDYNGSNNRGRDYRRYNGSRNRDRREWDNKLLNENDILKKEKKILEETV